MKSFAQSIVETMRHPLVILDDRLHVQKANPSFYTTFRLTPEETESRSFFDLQGGLWSVPRLRRLLEEIVPGDRSFADFEVEGNFPDLGRRLMVLNGRRVEPSEDGDAVILLAIEDLTEKRQVQDELRRLNGELERRVQERTAQLEASNRELEVFCYSVSHDLRTPLRAIEGFSEELLQRYSTGLDARGQHYLTRIRAGSQRMASLIDDLLDLSRVSRGEMRRERVELSVLAQQVAEELRRGDPERTVHFTIQPHLHAPGDRQLLRLVLENLLGNAWKFTSRQPEGRIEFGQREEEGATVFFVRDNGAGFDMAYADKLFGAFQRLHSDRDFPGTGIGLATVQRVIHRHGGRTWGEGLVNQGATFYFSLNPRDDEP